MTYKDLVTRTPLKPCDFSCYMNLNLASK